MSIAPIRAIEKLAEENVRKWITSERVRARLSGAELHHQVGPYVLISRETGAGGSEIARLVGAQLSWDVLDREIIDYLAEQFGTTPVMVEHVDERHSNWLAELLGSWSKYRGLTSISYVHRLSRLLWLAARHGNVVIVGRGARFILPRQGGLSIRILAPLDFRVEQIAAQRGICTQEARKFVMESDRQQEAFVQEYFHCRAADPHLYDLVLNVETLDAEDAAELIVETVRLWKSSTRRSSNLACASC